MTGEREDGTLGEGMLYSMVICRLHGYIKSSQAWLFHCVEMYIKNCGLCVEVGSVTSCCLFLMNHLD